MPDVARTAGINVRPLNLLYFHTFALTHSATKLPSDLERDKGCTMWKWTNKEESKPTQPSTIAGTPSAAPPVPSVPSREHAVLTPQSAESFRPDVAHIGKSIAIKGELSGSEGVYLDGELEGRVELLDGSLTVGPDGRIRANLQAPQIVVRGRVDGNLYGRERVDLKKSAILVGDIYTSRIAIEELRGVRGRELAKSCRRYRSARVLSRCSPQPARSQAMVFDKDTKPP